MVDSRAKLFYIDVVVVVVVVVVTYILWLVTAMTWFWARVAVVRLHVIKSELK